MLAKVNGVFRLSQDVELRYLSDGKELAKLNLVNSNKFKKASGEQVEDTCFIEGTIFGKLANVANTYLRKGSKIYIDADLKQDTWEDNQSGQKRSKHTLKINTFEMLDSKSDNQSQGQSTSEDYNNNHQGQQRQQSQVQYQNNQGQNVSQEQYNQQSIPSIDEDSIPF